MPTLVDHASFGRAGLIAEYTMAGTVPAGDRSDVGFRVI
jgi:hypothetical protein